MSKRPYNIYQTD